MIGNRERILVADDHRENVRFITDSILEPNGFRALCAHDGVRALRLALTEQPDLILLDLQMPKMHGLEVLETLRAQGVHIPVVLMTFHGSEEIAVQGFRLGARDYIIKPFTVEEMLRAIENALTESRLRQERDAVTARLMQVNQQLERRLREMRTLYAVGQSVTSVLDLRELLTRVLDAVLYLSPAWAVSILLTEGGTGVLRTAAERYRKALSRRVVDKARHEAQAVEVLRSHTVITTPPGEGLGACIYVPLEVRSQAVGVLVVQWSPDSHDPDQHDIQLLSSLADYAAIAIDNARGFQRLEIAKEREKEQIRDRFRMYVAPMVVERVLSDADAASLGGARQEVSVLFADLCGFSTLSEKMAPEQLVPVLNRYLSIMADTIISHEGTIDKFLGDGLMAFFNAPLTQPDHPLDAARAGLDLQSAIARFQSQLAPELRLGLRLGINTGEAVVGNIGTSRALSYTAIGDAVNVARRLQERASSGQILISEEVFRRVQDRVEARPLGTLLVKGRRRGEKAYELLRLRT